LGLGSRRCNGKEILRPIGIVWSDHNMLPYAAAAITLRTQSWQAMKNFQRWSMSIVKGRS
jgi:hypothetical protein